MRTLERSAVAVWTVAAVVFGLAAIVTAIEGDGVLDGLRFVLLLGGVALSLAHLQDITR